MEKSPLWCDEILPETVEGEAKNFCPHALEYDCWRPKVSVFGAMPPSPPSMDESEEIEFDFAPMDNDPMDEDYVEPGEDDETALSMSLSSSSNGTPPPLSIPTPKTQKAKPVALKFKKKPRTYGGRWARGVKRPLPPRVFQEPMEVDSSPPSSWHLDLVDEVGLSLF